MLSARVGLPPAHCGSCAGLRGRRAPAAALRKVAQCSAAADAPQPAKAAAEAKPAPIAGYVGGRPLAPNKKKAEKAAKSGVSLEPKIVLPKALLCPCCSGAAYDACCGQYHVSGGGEPDAEAVLRARYSAYVKGDEAGAKYIVGSTHPRSPDLARKGEAGSTEAQLQLLTDTAATMKNVRFQTLDITRSDRGATEQEWFVSFRASYEPASAARDAARSKPGLWREPTASKFLIEKARFLKDAATGRWLFFSSTQISGGLGEHGTKLMPPAAPPAAA